MLSWAGSADTAIACKHRRQSAQEKGEISDLQTVGNFLVSLPKDDVAQWHETYGFLILKHGLAHSPVFLVMIPLKHLYLFLLIYIILLYRFVV